MVILLTEGGPVPHGIGSVLMDVVVFITVIIRQNYEVATIRMVDSKLQLDCTNYWSFKNI